MPRRSNPAQFDLFREAPPPPDLSWRPPDSSTWREWNNVGVIGIDTETTGLLFTDQAIGISIAFQDGLAQYFPFGHQDAADNLPRETVLAYFRREAAHFTGVVCGHNLVFDLEKLHQLGITFPKAKGFRDTMLAAKLLNEWHQSYSLDAVAGRMKMVGKDEQLLAVGGARYGIGIGEEKAGLWKMAARYVGPYAEQDARLPLDIYAKQWPELKKWGLQCVWALECDVLLVLLAMRLHGVRVDVNGLERLIPVVEKVTHDCAKIVSERTGYWMNPADLGRPDACHEALITEGGYQFQRTEKGSISIDKDWLTAQRTETCDAILRGRKYLKLRNTFIDGILTRQVKGRIPTDYNQMVRTGRLSSRSPNLQNIPSRDAEIAKAIKDCFLPDEDCVFVDPDYSGQELRMALHFAVEANFFGAWDAAQHFQNDPDFDFHGAIAKAGSIDRHVAKTVVFAYLYGGGPGRICHVLGLPTETKLNDITGDTYIGAGPEGQHIIDAVNNEAPYFKQLTRASQKDAELDGHIRTITGRLCRFRRRQGEYDKTYRAFNSKDQGSSADQTKTAMVALHRAGYLPQLQIHDAIIRSVPLGIAGIREIQAMASIMETCMPLNVPSRVEWKMGDTWGSCNKVYFQDATGGWNA